MQTHLVGDRHCAPLPVVLAAGLLCVSTLGRHALVFVRKYEALGKRNSAVRAWICGPDMVEWLQGAEAGGGATPSPASPIFHSYVKYKVKPTT